MTRPRLLDLFCGAGGAAVGYARAGFEVVGVDNRPQPNYPFEFIQEDTLKFLNSFSHPYPTHTASDFDAIHASPPCQGYSRMRHLPWLRDRDYPLLIDEVRAALKVTGLPFVIENVADAPLDPSITLCGLMFDLPIYRHRRFELSHWMLPPGHPKHEYVIAPGRMFGARQRVATESGFVADPTYHGAGRNSPELRQAMGIDWMKRDELAQAIPPAYTQWIGEQLRVHLERGAA